MAEYRKPIPRPTPETQDFWDGAKAGNLRLQRCDDCSHVYFPPRPFCPKCASRSVSSFNASGKGKLHSYVINHRPPPGFQEEGDALVREGFGAQYGRLAALKSKYDPHNLFRLNQNVKPES